MGGTTKFIFVVAVVSVVIVGVGLFLFFLRDEEKTEVAELHESQDGQETQRGKGGEAEQQISLKESIEKEIIETKGAGRERFALQQGAEKNAIVAYFPPEYHFVPEEKIHDGQIAVFRVEDDGTVEKFWESEDVITLSLPTVAVRDITGDGNVEIISIWSDGKTDILYLYSWTGDTFKLITPTRQVRETSSLRAPVFGVYRGSIQVKDLDDDNVEEVIISGGVMRDEFGGETPIQRETIYKWNGAEYYLWREERVTVPVE